jgi:hypothetical protein
MQDDVALNQAVGKLEQLKAEHAPLLRRIVGDPGMGSDLKQSLVEHIHEEEEEHMQNIAALAAGPRPSASPPSARPGLSVGTLRPVSPVPASGRVGSLRESLPPRPNTRGSVGSLWVR